MSSETDRPDESTGPQLDQPVPRTETGDVPMSELALDGEPAPTVVPDAVWIDTGRFGAWSEYRQVKKRREKRKKLARKGYVEWYLVDGNFEGPKFVKPTADGGGVPTIKQDDKRYLFPEQAAVPSAASGMRCYVHKAGELDPINLRDPADHALAPDQTQTYLDTDIQTDSPGLGLLSDYSAGELLFFALMAIVILAVGWSYIGGGA